jgi:hypothetical protein
MQQGVEAAARVAESARQRLERPLTRPTRNV